jgi:hypothetical protein
MNADLLALVSLAGYGAAGALVGAITKTHRLSLPRMVRQNGEDGGTVTLIDLGFLAAPVLGALTAISSASGPREALLYGFLAGVAGPAIVSSLVEPILHKLGLPAISSAATPEMDEEGKA